MKRTELSKALKAPSITYFSTLFIGLILGLFFIHPQAGKDIIDIEQEAFPLFSKVFLNNAIIVVAIYLSSIFTKYFSIFIYASNGIAHGITLGWIISSNIKLLILMLPHGIFEIPCLLATGLIVYKGESFIRNNPKKFFLYLTIHILAILFCALVEVFITPAIYGWLAM